MNKWKVIAITALLVCLIEFLFIYMLFQTDQENKDKELECIINVCEGYKFSYYHNSGMCYCADTAEKVDYQKYIG